MWIVKDFIIDKWYIFKNKPVRKKSSYCDCWDGEYIGSFKGEGLFSDVTCDCPVEYTMPERIRYRDNGCIYEDDTHEWYKPSHGVFGLVEFIKITKGRGWELVDIESGGEDNFTITFKRLKK